MKDLIRALRCSSAPGVNGDCKKCKWSCTEYIKPGDPLYHLVVPDEKLEDGTEVFISCDSERICIDAAEALERLMVGEDDGR